MVGHQCSTVDMKTEIMQRLLVLPILFIIYLSRIFKEVGREYGNDIHR